jgi:SNF2 family DNA or RNA helicase
MVNQLAGLKWMVAQHDKGAGCILGDEMGLGNTPQRMLTYADGC